MYFDTKNYLKNNHYHTAKYILKKLAGLKIHVLKSDIDGILNY